MVTKILDKIKALFFGRWLKDLLDKVPANGKKTYFGFLFLALGILLETLSCATTGGTICLALTTLQATLGSVGGFDLIVDPAVISIVTGAITGLIGLYHKVLKAIWAKEEKKK